MKTLTLFGSYLVHIIRKSRSYRFQKFHIFRSFRLNKEGYFPEINFTLLTESLHGVKHSITFRIFLPNTHRDTARRMYQQRILLSFRYLRQ